MMTKAIEFYMLIVLSGIVISGLITLKRLSDNEHKKNPENMLKNGNKMAVSCLFLIWIIMIYLIMAVPHHINHFCDCGFFYVVETHEYRMIHRIIAYAMILSMIKIINQIIAFQERKNK